MCEPITLFESRDGYVVRCKHCGYTQVAFGTTLINIEMPDFQIFLEMVRKICNEDEVRRGEDVKNILIPTSCHEIFIILTPAEVFRLLIILERADDEIKASQLFHLFDK